jgi:hypothetical protein
MCNPIPVDAPTLQRLREIRLYHWRWMMTNAKARDAFERKGDRYAAKEFAHKASEHLGFVQSLNDFFPIGDTAERDYNNCGPMAERATHRMTDQLCASI